MIYDDTDGEGCIHLLCDALFPHDLLCVYVLRGEDGTIMVPGGTLERRTERCIALNRRAGVDGPVHVPAHERGDPRQFIVQCSKCDDDALLVEGCDTCDSLGTVILTMPSTPEVLFA